jgi:hypothetical protein
MRNGVKTRSYQFVSDALRTDDERQLLAEEIAFRQHKMLEFQDTIDEFFNETQDKESLTEVERLIRLCDGLWADDERQSLAMEIVILKTLQQKD